MQILMSPQKANKILHKFLISTCITNFFQIVDLLVRYLKAKPSNFGQSEVAQQVFVQAYIVLETYLLGDSRKNELYFAKHIQYFSTQFEELVSFMK